LLDAGIEASACTRNSTTSTSALILDFQNANRPPSWNLKFSQYLSKIQSCAYFYVRMKNLMKIGRSAAELLRVFNFQNGGHPPSWIWYDVILDHPRHVFDGPSICHLPCHFSLRI